MGILNANCPTIDPMTNRRPLLNQPLDRAALTVIALLSVMILAVLLGGSHAAPKVRDFSWQNKQVGAEDRAFLLTFNRPMAQASVEANLRIDPVLPGKISWAGRRMAYTLERPAPYGETFTLQLKGARDRFTQADGKAMELFTGTFRTRDRAFAYLGVEGEDAGRLLLYNMTRQEKQVLTPPDLVVMDFEPYPEGDRILFSASQRSAQSQGLLDQQLYTVTTGIYYDAAAQSPGVLQLDRAPGEEQPPGIITPILDSKEYQNLKFDLSPDGKTIVVQRVNRTNPGDFGLWIVTPDEPPRPLKTEPGGDFLIAPDGNTLAMAQGQGMAILPLAADSKPLDFLPKFGMTLAFAKDGSAAAMVKFNVDPRTPTRSLFVVTNQGTEQELLTTEGSILNAYFSPNNRLLYALVTRRLPGEAFLEQPFLTAINLESAKRTDLLLLPVQREVQMALAPDGLALLFDQIVEQAPNQPPNQPGDSPLRSSQGTAIASSQLWLLPLVVDPSGNPVKASPQELPLPGLRPRWLP